MGRKRGPRNRKRGGILTGVEPAEFWGMKRNPLDTRPCHMNRKQTRVRGKGAGGHFSKGQATRVCGNDGIEWYKEKRLGGLGLCYGSSTKASLGWNKPKWRRGTVRGGMNITEREKHNDRYQENPRPLCTACKAYRRGEGQGWLKSERKKRRGSRKRGT